MPYTLNINTNYLRTTNSKFADREKDPEQGKCNNFNERLNGGKPEWIMEHHTAGGFAGSLNIFLTGAVSTHYMIDKDGTVYSLVADQYRAYHAGSGSLKYGSKLHHTISEEALKGNKGTGDMNSWSIGIENVNSGFEPFTPAQTLANVYLHEKLVKEHGINPKNLVSHADWVPGRKIDPNPYYDWKSLSTASEKYEDIEHNFGVYPKVDIKKDPEIVLSYKKQDSMEDIAHVQKQLEEVGYNIVESDQSNYGIYDKKTRDASFSFTIRYMNEYITTNSEKLNLWNLVDNQVNGESARNELSAWTQSHDDIIIDVLGQYEG